MLPKQVPTAIRSIRWLLIGVLGLGLLLFWALSGSESPTRPVSAQTGDPLLDSLRNYHIAYIVDETSIIADRVSPARLEAATSAQVARSWREVLALDAQRPLDALIIHASASSLVDRAWIADAYHRGVVIAVFDIPATELGQWIGNPCLGRNFTPYPGSYYLIVYELILTEIPADAARIRSAHYGSCGEVIPLDPEGLTVQHGDILPDAEGHYLHARGSAHYDMETDFGFAAFSHELAIKLSNVSQARQDFAVSTSGQPPSDLPPGAPLPWEEIHE